MLNQSAALSESPHFHPPIRVISPSMPQGVVRKPTLAAESAPQRRIAKRLPCKACLGQCCSGRCRL
jgi:hypothetical protein